MKNHLLLRLMTVAFVCGVLLPGVALAAIGDVTVVGPSPATVAAGDCFSITYAVDVGPTPLKLGGARLRLISDSPDKVELKAVDVSGAMVDDRNSWSIGGVQPPAATATQFDVQGRISMSVASSSSSLGSGVRKLLAVEVCVKPTATAGDLQLSLEFRDPLAMLTGANQSQDVAVNPNPATFSINVSTGPGSCTVPNVVGQTQSAATAAITAANLTVGTVTSASSATVPSGSVISTSPVGGQSVACNSAVNLVVSTGPAPTCTVPNVAGQTQAAATAAITAANLTVGTVSQASSATVPSGSVISTTPAGGASVACNSAVNLVVSTGPDSTSPALSVTPESATAPASGATRTFTVANTGDGTLNWAVSSGCNWVTVSPANGTNGGTVQAVVQANTTNQQRSCTLTFTASGATGSPKSLTITQSGAGALSVTPASRSVGAAAGSTTFAVATAGEWTAASNQGWATVSPASGTGNGTVTVTYAANTGAARTATITVTAPGATGSPKTVTVNQGPDETSCNRTLAAPSGFSATGFVGLSGDVLLTWQLVPTATAYRIYRTPAFQSTLGFEQAEQIATVTGFVDDTGFYVDETVIGGSYFGCFGFGLLSCGDRIPGPSYTYWVVAVDDACGIVGPPSIGARTSSWKEETGGNSADAGVLVTMILALVLVSRFYHKRLRA